MPLGFGNESQREDAANQTPASQVGSGGGTTRGARRTTNSAAATTFTRTDVPLISEKRTTELLYTSFPENLEQSGSPYMLIKIFETITGAADIVDPTTASLRSGADVFTKVSDTIFATTGADRETQSGIVAGFATGSFAIGALTAAFGEEALGLVNRSLGVDLGDVFKNNLKNFNLKRNSTQLEHAIALFMPDGLNANYDQEYDAISITQTLGLIGTLAQAVSDKGGDIDPYVMEAASAAASKFLGDDFQKVGLFATTGRTVNPQLELMYTSPNLRTFTFDFRLIPRNAVESNLIKIIIDKLKYYSAPRIPNNTSGRYFIPPAQFEIEFYNSPNNSNPFLFKTKKCALKSISVDYSPNGFATFANGAPVETRLQLQFQETTILDRNAIAEGY
jgi:hypothetical protein